MSHKTRPSEQHRRVHDHAGVPREDCEHPHKHAYATRKAARAARQRVGKKVSIYKCRCGNYHLGRLPPSVISGEHPRRRHA